MRPIISEIRQAMPRHTELVVIISESSDAVSGLAGQKEVIKCLNRDLSEVRECIAELQNASAEQNVVSEESEVTGQDEMQKEGEASKPRMLASMKRFFEPIESGRKKLGARYQEGQEHEQAQGQVQGQVQEGLDDSDINNQIRLAQDRENTILDWIAKSSEIQRGFEERVDLRRTAEHELDRLYTHLFQGPTEAFPEEDEHEITAYDAMQEYHNIASKAENEGCAANLLEAAITRLEEAYNHTERALNNGTKRSEYSPNDLAVINALDEADIDARKGRVLVLEAQVMSSEVPNLLDIKTGYHNLMLDFLSKPWATRSFMDAVHDSRLGLHNAKGQLAEERKKAVLRHHKFRLEAETLGAAEVITKEKLQKERRKIFYRVAPGDEGIPTHDPPPFPGAGPSNDPSSCASKE
ncbi:hypothetical protein GGS23DRAFT_615004 [Durotheca rogersii]|uniref:uncharacterized protein n=1 Tax=Durotheca rogersii TaxID=419775 RepID=UPI00221FFFCE|nr:uncharacterized protein GGS23DRAFT_615004 [Durotheca rogersii]KAI5866522.1 hypothetical protein GGS23DRAFT_615004 [Durotheca rogersii]